MIEREEIEAQSKSLDVHIANVERDYVFGWLLKAFYEHPFLARHLIFKGGNCMRKAYYPDTRFSADLDFGVTDVVDPDLFGSAINEACRSAQDACGVLFETDKNTFSADRMIDRQRQAFKGRVYFKDFYGNDQNLTISVKLDVTEFDRLVLPATTRTLIHPYSDAAACRAEIQCVAIEELVANKLKCLLQRRHSFDLYDLVYAAFFQRTVEVDRGLVLNAFLKKTIFERSPGSAKQILLGLPLAFFKGVWNKYIICPSASRFEFEEVADGFKSVIASIFGDARTQVAGPDPFYPAEYRNMILEAGAERKLMEITYDGKPRKIEPYSLVYKRRQDGRAFEYFYAWDQTGGNSSPPGIKTFFHHKIEHLAVRDEKFEPQYEIELSKAGEPSGKGYFGKPFLGNPTRGRPTRRRRQRKPSNPFEQKFIVECPYCQKRFTRKSHSTRLNPHKDANGYPCYGRQGYQVW